MSIPDNNALKPSNLTVELWAKPHALANTTVCGANPHTTQYMLFKRNPRLGNFEGYTMILDGATLQFVFFVTNASSVQVGLGSKTTFQLDTWYHVVGTFSRPNLNIYVNGKLELTKTFDSPLDYGSRPLFLGRTGECGGTGEATWDGYYDGQLDEVAIYDTALSDAQILLHFQAGASQLQALEAYPLLEIIPRMLRRSFGF